MVFFELGFRVPLPLPRVRSTPASEAPLQRLLHASTALPKQLTKASHGHEFLFVSVEFLALFTAVRLLI